MNLKKESLMNIIKTLLDNVVPHISIYLNKENVILDFISDFIRIINPRIIRPITWQLLNENEKKLVQRLTEIYATFGVTWKEERDQSSQRRRDKQYRESGEEFSFSLSPYTRLTSLFSFHPISRNKTTIICYTLIDE
jgi:hypothetical protein